MSLTSRPGGIRTADVPNKGQPRRRVVAYSQIESTRETVNRNEMDQTKLGFMVNKGGEIRQLTMLSNDTWCGSATGPILQFQET
ncbi:unnamed protein product [Protopolystoma xenopodis]|uniref:Uncharacterized protein n=1 Tax=Protopolystoma xenopodis TaxID=117903 RepID=A0A3S5AHE5_9PLAT|nr:unnamed protein product [Protopolystoma xenopodis]